MLYFKIALKVTNNFWATFVKKNIVAKIFQK